MPVKQSIIKERDLENSISQQSRLVNLFSRKDFLATLRVLSGQDMLLHRKDGIWWSQAESNRRPRHCERRALPTELWPRLIVVLSNLSWFFKKFLISFFLSPYSTLPSYK